MDTLMTFEKLTFDVALDNRCSQVNVHFNTTLDGLRQTVFQPCVKVELGNAILAFLGRNPPDFNR